MNQCSLVNGKVRGRYADENSKVVFAENPGYSSRSGVSELFGVVVCGSS